jgi:hypothetical protein
MFTTEQYRVKATEYAQFLTDTPRSSSATSELLNLQQACTELVENGEWPAHDSDKTRRHRRRNRRNGTGLAEDEKQILRCLGAAVIMQWNTLPTKLQRELFARASTIGDLQQTASLKGQMARFLHNHKDDDSDSAPRH